MYQVLSHPMKGTRDVGSQLFFGDVKKKRGQFDFEEYNSAMGLIDGLGCWARLGNASTVRGASALFLDRDGVIVQEVGYLARPENVQLIEGAASAIAHVNALGIPVVAVSNQSGIARGLYTWSDFQAVQDALEQELARHSAHLDLVLACGYYGVGHGKLNIADHAWRKPRPGMLLAARDQLKLDLETCFIVGDRISDLEAGYRAGLRRGSLVRTGYGSEAETRLAELPSRFFASTVNSLAEAIEQNSAFLLQSAPGVR